MAMSLFIKTILITALLATSAVNKAQATMPSLSNNFHTPSTPLVLEPRFSSSIKVAGVYWLPDYLENNLDFSDRQDSVNCDNPKESDYNPNHPACKKIDDRECEGLGYKIPSFVSDWSKYTYTEFLAANRVRCYKNFLCKDNFSKSSCPQWYQLAGNSCRDTRGTFYERCDPKPCPATYTAGVTSCSPAAGYNYSSNGYSGAQICGRCDAKACASGSVSSSCGNGYTAQANGAYSGSSPCYNCVANACSGYGAKKEGSGWNCTDTCLSGSTTKYKCVAKVCAEGSLSLNCDSVNYDTVNTSSYSGDSVCRKCDPKPCPTSKDCTYGCKTWDISRQAMCGKICTECNTCTPKAAATGCSYGTESCTNGCGGTTTCCKGCTPYASETGCSYGTESCSNGCGGTRTCCKACATGGSSSCSGQTTACGSTQVQTSSCKDCSGTTRYTCKNKTCAEQGLKDCNGSCIAKTACCGGCSSVQKCSNGTCVNKVCEDYGYYTGACPADKSSIWSGPKGNNPLCYQCAYYNTGVLVGVKVTAIDKACYRSEYNIFLGYKYSAEFRYNYWCQSSLVGAKCLIQSFSYYSTTYYKTESEAKADCEKRLKNPAPICKAGEQCPDCRLVGCQD